MTAPIWVTPPGPILKQVATANGNGASGSHTLYIDNSTAIRNGQVIQGGHINTNTLVSNVYMANLELSITAINGNGNVISVKHNGAFPPFEEGQSVVVNDGITFSNANVTISRVYYGEYNVLTSTNLKTTLDGTIQDPTSTNTNDPLRESRVGAKIGGYRKAVTLDKALTGRAYGEYSFSENIFLEDDVINCEFITTSTVDGTSTGSGMAYLVTGANTWVNDLVVGEHYTITDLGTTNWNTIAGTSNVTYSVGDTITKIQDTGRAVLPTTISNANSFSSLNYYRIETLGNTNWNMVANTTGVTYSIGDAVLSVNRFDGTGTQMTLASTDTVATALLPASDYQITSLGNTNWNAITGTSNTVYSVNDIIKTISNATALTTAAGSSNGTAKLFTVGSSQVVNDWAPDTWYQITSLGSMTQTQWNRIAGTNNRAYQQSKFIKTSQALVATSGVGYVATKASTTTQVKNLIANEWYVIETLGNVDWASIAGTTGITYRVGSLLKVVTEITSTSAKGLARKLTSTTTTTYATSFEKGTIYKIVSLGSMTYTQEWWNYLAGTINRTYAVGDYILVKNYTANNVGTGTGTRVPGTGEMVVGGEYHILALGTENWNSICGTSGKTYTVGQNVTVKNPGSTHDGAAFRYYKSDEIISAYGGGTHTYKIVTLGDTNWNSVAGTTNVTYHVGDSIQATYRTGWATESLSVMPVDKLEINKQYVIYSLGNTDWNTVAETVDVVYSVGDIITIKCLDYSTTGTMIAVIDSKDLEVGNTYTIARLGSTNWNYLTDTTSKIYKVGDTITVLQHEKVVPVIYSLLNGHFPRGNLVLNSINNRAYLTGTLGKVSAQTTSVFTIRATTVTNGITYYSDRTFSIQVRGKNTPTFTTPQGMLGNEYKRDRLNANIAAPKISSVTVASNAVTLSIAPYNLESFGITANTMVFVSGLTSFPYVDNTTWYVNNIDMSNSKVTLYNDSGANDIYVAPISNATYTPSGTMSVIPYDSEYFSANIQTTLPIDATTVTYEIISGNLPLGLEMSPTGHISGYPQPPLDYYDQPTLEVNRFTIRATTETGNATANFVIPVCNQEYLWNKTNPGDLFPGRIPVILNGAPKSQIKNTADPYYSFYRSGQQIGEFEEKVNLQYKLVGYDWNKADDQYNDSKLIYNVYGLEEGAAATAPFSSLTSPSQDIATGGWITGTTSDLKSANIDIKRFYFDTSLSVASVDDELIIHGERETLNFVISSTISPTITWNTDSNLGSINTGEVSRLSISATFDSDITDEQYRIVGGKLPPTLQLLKNGDIIGRVVFEPTSEAQSEGDTNDYEFTVEAYSPKYLEYGVTSEKTFTLTTVVTTSQPYDTIYVRALLPREQRYTIQELLNDIKVKQSANVYRASDTNFGIAPEIRYIHAYGATSQNANDFYTKYANVIKKNHYFKQLILGDLQVAVARDNTGNIIYEVVYSPIIDKLSNTSGVSVSKAVTWPYPIVVDDVTLSRTVYPNSLANMRSQLEASFGQVNTQSILPLWMTSQQRNGSDTGYVPAWVLCYTLPDRGAIVRASIETFLSERGMTLNQFNFSMDRFEVDRTMSYTWGTTADDSWPQISAKLVKNDTNIIVDSTSGLEMNQPIKFRDGANTANITTDVEYFISEINPRYNGQQSIKIRPYLYGNSTSIIKADANSNMTMVLTPLSPGGGDNTVDSYVVFDQETILRK